MQLKNSVALAMNTCSMDQQDEAYEQRCGNLWSTTVSFGVGF